MQWEDYRKVYNSYQLAVSQSRTLTVVAGEVLEDFPYKLPVNLKTSWGGGLLGVLRAYQAFMQKEGAELGAIGAASAKALPLAEDVLPLAEELGATQNTADVFENGPFVSVNIDNIDFFTNAIRMYLAATLLDASPKEVMDFERLLCSQELTMLFAHLDAFMADTLRAICRKRPEVLKTGKQIDWASVLSLGGWEALVEHLVELYIYDFGWLRFPKRVDFLCKQLGLAIECPQSALEVIEEAENIRDIVVHDAGRVSQKYIDRTGKNDLPVGAFVPVTLDYVEKVANASQTFARALFVATSQKFFNVDASKQSGVWILHNGGMFQPKDVGT